MTAISPLPLIDEHVHIGDIRGIGSIGEILNACSLDKLALLSLTVPHNISAENEWYHATFVDEMGVNLQQNPLILLLKAMHPGRIYAFGGLHHALPGTAKQQIDLVAQVSRLRDIGIDGIKMIEGHAGARLQMDRLLDDPWYDAYYAYMESVGLPIIFHVASPWYWHGNPPRELDYRAIDHVLVRWPKLKFIFAHFYFLDANIQRAADFLERWKNVAFDLTPHWVMYENFAKDIPAWREFFVRYQDRIILGTDNSGGRHSNPANDAPQSASCMGIIRNALETEAFVLEGKRYPGLCLDEAVLSKLYAVNFLRYVGAQPAPLNLPLAIDEAKSLLQLAEASPQHEQVAPDMRYILNKMVTLEER